MENYWRYLIPLALIAGMYGYRAWIHGRIKGRMRSPEGQQALVQFFESTGYRYEERLHGSPAEQAEFCIQMAEDQLAKSQKAHQASALSYRAVMRREFDEMVIVWVNGYVRGTPLNEWKIAQPPAIRLCWQAITRSKLDEISRRGGLREIKISDPEIDKAVAVFGNDEAGIQTAMADPGLKDALLSLTYVNLTVDKNGIGFDDPTHVNARAGMGGYIGAVLSMGNMGSTMGLSAPIHDQIADLMTRAARAST